MQNLTLHKKPPKKRAEKCGSLKEKLFLGLRFGRLAASAGAVLDYFLLFGAFFIDVLLHRQKCPRHSLYGRNLGHNLFLGSERRGGWSRCKPFWPHGCLKSSVRQFRNRTPPAKKSEFSEIKFHFNYLRMNNGKRDNLFR